MKSDVNSDQLKMTLAMMPGFLLLMGYEIFLGLFISSEEKIEKVMIATGYAIGIILLGTIGVGSYFFIVNFQMTDLYFLGIIGFIFLLIATFEALDRVMEDETFTTLVLGFMLVVIVLIWVI